jgi:hypothetical protein
VTIRQVVETVRIAEDVELIKPVEKVQQVKQVEINQIFFFFRQSRYSSQPPF